MNDETRIALIIISRDPGPGLWLSHRSFPFGQETSALTAKRMETILLIKLFENAQTKKQKINNAAK